MILFVMYYQFCPLQGTNVWQTNTFVKRLITFPLILFYHFQKENLKY
jgi:hypothetical protein